jgi:seryl-tRNA synthetase
MDSQGAYLCELVKHGLLIRTGVDGLYGFNGPFDEIVERFNTVITRWGSGDGAEIMRFPPALSRQHLEESDYLRSFPQLAGTVHSFIGDDRDHLALLDALERNQDWTAGQKATQVVMTPAACYPVYPAMAARGRLPKDGGLVDVCSYCFRHEPSADPARMQLFRMREYVRLGTPQQVTDFRDLWLDRGQRLMTLLELPHAIDCANDPFFGRAGRMLANNQRDQQLKFELLIPITSNEKPTACASFNNHQDHFGHPWGLQTSDGQVAHTACVGFGLERIALALFKHHGFDSTRWPPAVRHVLWT